MKRLLTLATILIVVGGLVWGILWLENMRKESAEEARKETESALQG